MTSKRECCGWAGSAAMAGMDEHGRRLLVDAAPARAATRAIHVHRWSRGFVHIVRLIGLRSRLVVLVGRARAYVARQRSRRKRSAA
jgi:hypothetical protein